MRAEKSLRSQIDRSSRERGDVYFEENRVRKILREDDAIIADVRGSRVYTVTFGLDEELLIVRCTCPFFVGNGAACKHIWATIREASRRNLLPDGEMVLEIDETGLDADEGDDHAFDRYEPLKYAPRIVRSTDVRPPPASDDPKQQAGWRKFLSSLRSADAARPQPGKAPEEIAYVIWNYPRANGFMLELLGRARKKNGEWGSWKAWPLDEASIGALDSIDRENLMLLYQRSFYDTDRMVPIVPRAAAWWVERLARQGRLMVRNGDAELEPIAWDDGPSWTLEVAIESDASNALYRIDAKVVRDGEALPLGEIESVVGGIVFSRRRASRFDDRGHGAWLNALRANGPIEVPHRDAEAFREALVRAPIANIALPPELGWTYVDVPPQPVLALAHDSWASEMHGELLFQYDEWRVSSQSQERQKTFGRRLIRRDRSREEGLRARVAHAGAIVTWNGLRVRQSQLEALVRSLTAEGWSIEIESKPVRLADALDLEISSGIDWFDLEVRASFGDDRELRLPQLLAASEAKRSLVHLSDGSYGILPDGWDEPLSSLADYGTKRDDAFRFRPSQALLVDALLGSKANVDAPFERWRERISGAEPMPREEPKSLRAKLRPYQQAGLGWLHFLRESGLGGCLADDMGLGKTVQALALLEGLRASGSTRPSLVVAPRSLLFNWSAEAKRFAPELRVVEHHGAGRDLDAMGDCDVVLTTYATMRLDIAQLSSIEFEYAILDEAQAIKNASSQVAKATRLLRAQHRLALSGTPIENHLGELWSLFEFLNPGLLGTSRAFSRTFASKSVSPERRAALARALRPLILRRTKDQVAPELPARIEQTRLCELEGKQKKLYVELREHYRQALLGRVQQSGIEKSRMQILEALLRLRQAACAPALIDPSTDAPSAKLELLMSELREVLDAGHRALVFSQFTSFLALVQRELDAAGMAYLYLDGKTKNRQALVERFQSVDGPPLFLISLKAGGLGLNLTNADYIFLLDPWWNPAVEAQAIDRAHRIGRQKPVVAYRLIARDTVEEKILELQSRKRELAESIISQDNSVLRKLELEDLELLLG